MAKEPEQLEVHLGNDWFTGARLLKVRDNPHILPPEALNELPSSAKVKKGEDLVPVTELRNKPADEKGLKV